MHTACAYTRGLRNEEENKYENNNSRRPVLYNQNIKS